MKSKTLLASLISAALLVGCSDEATTKTVPQAPLVAAHTVESIQYQQGKTYIGRIEAMEDASIVAQVSGYIQSRSFKEGQMVEKGDVLLQIDPSTFEAQVANAKAGITQANAAFSGRISDSKVTLGDLVSPASGALTTLVSLNPIHTRS